MVEVGDILTGIKTGKNLGKNKYQRLIIWILSQQNSKVL